MMVDYFNGDLTFFLGRGFNYEEYKDIVDKWWLLDD